MNFLGPRTRSIVALGLFALTMPLAGQSCSSTHRITKVGERTYRIECEEALSKCLAQLDRPCAQGFKILQATDERRTYGVNVGDIVNEKRTSSAVAKCRSEAWIGGDEEEDENDPGALRLRRAPTASTNAPPPPVCVAGTTQACIGVGGCAGGQACLFDGTAFGPCECAPAPEPLPSATALSPSSTVAPAETAPALAPTPAPQPAPSSTAPTTGPAKPSP